MRRNFEPITKAEILVMELLSQGMSHKMIGDKLHRSSKTISKHVQNAMPKLKAKNAPHAVHKFDLRKFGNIDFTI